MSRSHFYSAAAAQNSAIPEDIKFPIEEMYLRSALFAGNLTLERILQYNIPQGIGVDVLLKAPHITVLRKAVRIILQGYGLTSELAGFDHMHDVYNNTMVQKVEAVQEALGFDTGNIDGVIGQQTLLAMDEELQRIRYYKFKGSDVEMIHNQQHWHGIHRFSEVYNGPPPIGNNPKTLRMRKVPDTSNPDFVSLPLGTKVLILEESGDTPAPPGWLYIQTLDNVVDPIANKTIPEGTYGYVYKAYVWIKSFAPDREATLRKVNSGEANALESIIKTKYGLSGSETWKYYALVALAINNPTGERWASTGEAETIYLHFTAGFVPTGFWANAFTAAAAVTSSPLLTVSAWIARLTTDYDTAEGTTNGLFDNIKLTPSAGDGQYMWLAGKQYADNFKSVVDQLSATWVAQDVASATAAWGILAQNAYQTAKNAIDQVMPVGWGVVLEGGLGITIGLPTGEVNAKMEIKRPKENIISIKKEGELAIGVEAAIGGKFSATMGRKPGKKRGDKNSSLFGLDASASASAKAYIKVSQTFEFPLDSAYAMVPMLMTALNQENNIGFAALRLVGNIFDWDIEPMDYLTELEVAAGIKGQAGASAGIGLTANTSDEDAKWSNDETLDPTALGETSRFDFFSLLSLIKLNLGISLNASIGGSLAYKVEQPDDNGEKFFIEEKSGARVPRKISMTLLLKGSYAGSLSGNIGNLGGSISGNADQEIKLAVTLKVEDLFDSNGLRALSGINLISEGTLQFTFEPTFKIGAKYATSLSDTSFDLTIDQKKWFFPATGLTMFDFQHYLDTIKEIKIKKRHSLSGLPKIKGSVGGVSYDDHGVASKSGDLTVIAKAIPKLEELFKNANLTKVGGVLQAEEFIEFEGVIEPEEVVEVFSNLFDYVADELGGTGVSGLEATAKVLAYLYLPPVRRVVNGLAVAYIVSQIYKKTDCKKLVLKKEYFAGGSVGIRVGLGVNAKLAISATVGLVYEKDVTTEMQEFFMPDGDKLSLANYLMALDQPKTSEFIDQY